LTPSPLGASCCNPRYVLNLTFDYDRRNGKFLGDTYSVPAVFSHCLNFFDRRKKLGGECPSGRLSESGVQLVHG